MRWSRECTIAGTSAAPGLAAGKIFAKIQQIDFLFSPLSVQRRKTLEHQLMRMMMRLPDLKFNEILRKKLLNFGVAELNPCVKRA